LQTEFFFEFGLLQKLREGKFGGELQNSIAIKSRNKIFDRIEDVGEMLRNKLVFGWNMGHKEDFGCNIDSLLIKIVQIQ
jgi:hypothetical protein